MKAVLLFLLRAYQLTLSPLLGPKCRFYPSCSQYAMDALRHHGVGHGCLLAARRLCKCHPLHPGGFDPVPAAKSHPPSPASSPISSTTKAVTIIPD